MKTTVVSAQRESAQRSRLPRGAAVLDPTVTEAILEAGLDELASRGYAGMSMDGIARRAGVGKSAIYRRWPSKEHLMGQLIARLGVKGHDDVPDTGSLRGDIRIILDEMVLWFGDDRTGPAFADLLAESMRNPALAEVMMTVFAEPRRARVAIILDRAAARGEVDGQADGSLALDLVAASVFWRLVARREPASTPFLDSIADLIVTQAAGTGHAARTIRKRRNE